MEYVLTLNQWVPEPNVWKFLKGGNVVDEEDIRHYSFDADVCSTDFISGWLRTEETSRAPQSSGSSASASTSTGTSSWDASACTGTRGTSTSSTRGKVTAVLQIS